MYLVPLKTTLRDAMMRTFAAADYPSVDFRGLHVSIEFPDKAQSYPGIWVDYEPTSVSIIGVDHRETVDSTLYPGLKSEFTRWAFKGSVTYTMVAFSSLERDRLHDEVLGVIAFGRENAARSTLRTVLESNEFVALDCDWDTVTTGGMSAQQGTPWGTDDIIYEATLSLRVVGDFVSGANEQGATLLPLTAITVYPRVAGTADVPAGGAWV